MSSIFRYQPFVPVSGSLAGEVPVVDDVLWSHEQERCNTSSFDENFIEFEHQTHRNYYVDLRQTCLVLNPKLVQGHGYETYNTKEVKKEHKEEAKTDEETEKEQEAPVLLVTHVNNLLHSIFFNIVVYINNQKKIQFKWIVCAQMLHFQQLQGSHL